MTAIFRLLVPVSVVLALGVPCYSQDDDALLLGSIRVAMGDLREDDPQGIDFERPTPRAAEKSRAETTIVWTPPVNSAPRVRVGGGVRGTTALPTPTALVPEHVALTTRATPSLFWHIDGEVPEGTRLFFTLVEEEEGLPLVETELAPPAGPGIQRVRLSDHAIELGAGTTYAWSVALVPDMQHRSADLVATAYVKRVPQATPRFQNAQFFAAEGLWYDALEALSDRVDERPEAQAPRKLRGSLLRQAGLRVGSE